MDHRALLVVAGLAVVILWLLLSAVNKLAPGVIEPGLSVGEQRLRWVMHATGAKIIGGYTDNFSYAGEAVRPVEGALELRLDEPHPLGRITVSLRTTQTSGPLHVSCEEKLVGEIRLVSRIDASASVSEETYIHGDTGIGGPELPRTYARIAGWSNFDLSVNGRLLYTELAGEWALVHALRRSDGAIRQSGLVYTPLLRDKTGFSDPTRSEFVLILHSKEFDPNNTPPYTVGLHLVFTETEISKSPTQEDP